MLKLVGKRLIDLLPVLLIVSFGIFMLMALVPGDAAIRLAGGPEASPERIEELREQMHLNDPLPTQYVRWVGAAATGDLGTSVVTRRPVLDELTQRLPATLSLAAGAAVVALVVGGTLGVLSGFRPGSRFDQGSRVVASLGVAMPSFWLGPLLVIFLAVQRNWLPPSGYVPFTESPSQWLHHIMLPSLTLGLVLAAFLARQLRAALIDVLDSNYVRTLWAKGATRRSVLLKHGLRNAAAPAITIFGMQLATLLGGTVIVEQVFAVPGLGDYLLRSIMANDIPVIQGAAILFVLTQLSMNLLVDLAYALLNPKVRLS
jgi:peptide/nickel transport system permease protein